MTGAAFSSWLTLGRDLSAKSALLLLTAWALTLAMRRASAAARHLVWLLAFAGLLALPLLSVTLPQHPVPVLPQPAAPLARTPAPIAAPPDIVRVAPSAPPPPALFTPARARPSAPPAWPRWVCLLWLGGVALTTLPLGMGWFLAVRRIRHCLPVTDPAVIALAADARRQIGVPRPVALRSGPGIAVPVTLGLFRPVVLLPEAAHTWPADRLCVALLHEFAHVRRGDWAAQTAARLVCALYWHNPLVWAAARTLRAEAERACDDLVLFSGVPGPDYAQHLLAVAAALSGADRPLPLAVPMAGRGSLESRLHAVLTARPRRAPSRRLAVVAFALAFAVLVPLAVLRPAARAARQTARRTILAAASLPSVILPSPPSIPAPSLTPPKSVGPSPTPPLPVPPIASQPTSKGVLPMKTLTPAKTVALAALAATLTLPAAQAKPTALVKRAPAPTLAVAHQQYEAVAKQLTVYKKAYAKATVTTPPPVTHGNLVSIDAPYVQVYQAVMNLFQDSNKNYVIEPGVFGYVFLKLNDVPFEKALNTLLSANSEPLTWTIEDGVYHIRPRALHAGEVGYGLPRQVQLKFEWASSAGASGTAPDKRVDALTIIAEEGRKAQVSSQHLQNGTGGEETISVLPHFEPGGMVVLDITERSDSTARAGDTKSNSAETTVRVKTGETGTVRVQASKEGGQGAERILFVTPTIVGAGGG